jgi:hypothetical protein
VSSLDSDTDTDSVHAADIFGFGFAAAGEGMVPGEKEGAVGAKRRMSQPTMAMAAASKSKRYISSDHSDLAKQLHTYTYSAPRHFLDPNLIKVQMQIQLSIMPLIIYNIKVEKIGKNV